MRLHQRLIGAISAVLIFFGQALAAEQSSYQPPTSGPMSMATFVGTYLNPALRALATCNWGTTAPANGPGAAVAAQQCWWDTSGTPYVLKWYVGAQWVAMANVNASTHAFTAPGLIIGTDVQAFDADLAALAANSTDGFWAHTGAGTGSARTLTAPAAGFTITNPAGIAGNPTFVLANDLAALEGLSSTGFAARTTTDTWAQRTLQAPAAGLSISNAAGVAGDPTFALANDLAALEGMSCTGVAIRSATDTWLCRTIGGTANEISVANGDGVSGAPTFSLPSALTFTGKTVTGGTYAGPAFTGVVDNQGAHKDSTQSAPTQITSDQNNYNPSSVVCATSATLLINSDAARNITGIAGGAAGCDLFLVNNGSFTITLKEDNASSTAGNRFQFGGDFGLVSKGAAHLKYDSGVSRWRNVTGSGSGGGSGTVTQVTCGTGLTGGTFTTSGTCATDYSSKSDQQTGSATAKTVNPAHQQDHDSAAKAWVSFTGSTGAVLASYNVTSVTRTGAGLFTVNFTTAFATANYACTVTSNNFLIGTGAGNQLAGSLDISFRTAAAVATDPGTSAWVICFGRQ